jgi:Rieske Fe-S protein
MPTLYPLDDDTQVSTPENRLRRQMLKGAVGTAVVAVLAYFGWTRYLFPQQTPLPQSSGKGNVPTEIKLGQVSDFAPSSPPKLVKVPIPQTEQVAAYFVENLGADNYRVLSAKCTHQGCNVDWNQSAQQFICPCHGAQYDLSGKVLSPPAPKPLPVVATKVENGMLYLTA